MRGHATAILALGMCGQPAIATPAACDLTSITKAADRFDQAQLQKNETLLDRMVADELVFITGSGERKGKREFIAGWMSPDTAYNRIILSDRVVTPLGPAAAIVSARTTLTGTSGGKSFSSRIRFSDTFRCSSSGQWQAVHIQVTRVADREQ